MTEPLYYAKDGLVWKRPIKTEHPDGSMSIAIGFPVCKPHDVLGPEAAETIALLMNAGHEAMQGGEK